MEYNKILISLAIIFVLLNQRTSQKDLKVVGGSTVNITQYPYQLFANMTTFYCGASIISADWALTAAHCLSKVTNLNQVTLRAGSSNKISGGILYTVAEFHIHPKYKRRTADYDFGLIKVNTPFALNAPGVSAVKLASTEPSVKTPVVISGWGLSLPTIIPTKTPQMLKAANLIIRNRLFCRLMFFNTGYSKRWICAGQYPNNACKGDSGGPLVNIKTGEQVGITSKTTTIFKCFPGMPAAYSNVANQRDWIRSISGV